MARLLSRVEATLWTGPRGHSGTVRTAAGGGERSSLLLPRRTTFRSPPPPLTALRGGIRASLESQGAEGSRVKRLPEVPGRRAQKVGGGGDGSARSSLAGPRRQNRNRNPRACPRWSQGPSPPAPPSRLARAPASAPEDPASGPPRGAATAVAAAVRGPGFRAGPGPPAPRGSRRLPERRGGAVVPLRKKRGGLRGMGSCPRH